MKYRGLVFGLMLLLIGCDNDSSEPEASYEPKQKQSAFTQYLSREADINHFLGSLDTVDLLMFLNDFSNEVNRVDPGFMSYEEENHLLYFILEKYCDSKIDHSIVEEGLASLYLSGERASLLLVRMKDVCNFPQDCNGVCYKLARNGGWLFSDMK